MATAFALLIYFWRDWVRIVRGLATSIAHREVTNSDQRLGWLLVLATIPVGISGLASGHVFRVYLSKPVPTAAFLVLNGVLLLVAEQLRRRADTPGHTAPPDTSGVGGAVALSVEQQADRRLPSCRSGARS